VLAAFRTAVDDGEPQLTSRSPDKRGGATVALVTLFSSILHLYVLYSELLRALCKRCASPAVPCVCASRRA